MDRQAHFTARAVSNAIVHAEEGRLACRGRVTRNASDLDCKVKDTATEVTQRK